MCRHFQPELCRIHTSLGTHFAGIKAGFMSYGRCVCRECRHYQIGQCHGNIDDSHRNQIAWNL